MVVYLDGVRQPQGQARADGQVAVVFSAPDERDAALDVVGLPVAADPVGPHDATRYEFHTGYDYISIRVPDFDHDLELLPPLRIYLNADGMVVEVGDEAGTAVLREQMNKGIVNAAQPALVLYHIFGALFEGDSAYLEDIEEELTALEGEVVRPNPRDCTPDILDIRRRLLVLKRYYEALYDLLEDLEENLNGFIPKQRLKSFRLHTNRADRLGNTVVSLRDYATQVREGYQNQLDIGLNQTMKLFTVVTTIFLPLTLLVGWYGMNLQMPEYHLPWVYPVVIAGSAAIVIALLVYFKKRKWF